MPRKNRRTPPQATHRLDRFDKWAKQVISDSQKKMSVTGDSNTIKKEACRSTPTR